MEVLIATLLFAIIAPDSCRPNKQIPTTRDSREESAVEIRFHVKRAIHRQIYTTPIVSGAFDFGVSSRQNRHRHTGVFVY